MRRPGSPESFRRSLLRPVCGSIVGLLFAAAPASTASDLGGGEYSLFAQSSVLGRNTGVPSGTGRATTSVGDVDFILESAFYFKNLELFGLDAVEGETLFGVLMPLRIRYRAAPGLSFELGAVVGEDFGDDERLNVAEPLIRLIYSPSEQSHIVAGTLYPTHWIHDALLDDTQKLRGRGEQGLQLRFDGPRFKQDLWINWSVRETGIRAEEFEIASSGQLRFLEDQLRLDLHAIWVHAGGQISLDDRLEHNLVFMLGGTWDAASTLVSIEDLAALRLTARLLYASKSGRNIDKINGLGWEIALDAQYQLRSHVEWRVHASYFSGDDLPLDRGDPLYTLDEYIQLGGTLLFRPLAGLAVETGIVGQWTEGKLNFGYQVNFVWGEQFATPFRARDHQSGSRDLRGD